jgi:predicted O-methyltransferase YrrM
MYWEKIDGFFNFGNIYSDIVRKSKNGAVLVEIGAWKGQSTVYMAEEIIKSGKSLTFYTIDNFIGISGEHDMDEDVRKAILYETYLKNIEPVKTHIKTIKKNSQEAYKDFEDNSIDFLFIDGDHNYKGVRADLVNWFPKVKQGGVFAGHDYTETTCDVRMAVDQFFLFTGIQINGSSWITIKK